MYSYYFMFLFLALFTIVDFAKERNKILAYTFFLFVIILSLFAGLRGEYVGPDYVNYMNIFFEVPSIYEYLFTSSDYSYIHGEWLFLIVNSVIKELNVGYVGVFLLIAFLSVGINLYFLKRYSLFFVLSVILYFSHIYFNKDFIQIRAGLASAILFFSFPYIVNRNFFKFSGVAFISGLIHSSAFIIFIIYYLYKFKFANKLYYSLLAISFMFGLLFTSDRIFDILIQMNLMPMGLAIYVGSTEDLVLGVWNPVTIKQIILSCIFLYFRYKIENLIKYFDLMILMYVFSTVWLLVFNDFSLFAARIASMLSFVELILFPSLLVIFKQKKISYYLIVLYAFTTFYINISVKNLVSEYYFVF